MPTYTLKFGAEDQSRDIDWQSRRGWRYTSVFEYEHPETEVTYLLVDEDGSTTGVYLDGVRYELWDTPDSLPLDVETIDHLREVEPYEHGSEGPMMNYWYPLRSYDFDVKAAAYTIRDQPLTVVEIGDEVGLALTGGGMDLSDRIAKAFVLLGMYPPAFIQSLPRHAGEADDQSIIRALIERDERQIEHLTHRLADFRARLTPEA